MTYIEFFDKTAIENLCACLTDAPEQVIFLGDNGKRMRRHIANYEKIFRDRGQSIRFSYRTVSKSNLSAAIETLERIVEDCDDCAFDITGGEEILLLALGIVQERHPDRNIQIHRFNVRHNTVCDCDADGQTIYKDTPTLSVADNILLYGGDIVYSDISGNKTYLWDLTPDFIADIDAMWSILRDRKPAKWNKQIKTLEKAEETGEKSEDLLTTTAPITDKKPYINDEIITDLQDAGLLTEFVCTDEQLRIRYKNHQVKRCLTKAGQVLEMKVYRLAKALEETDGTKVYDDAVNGVVIDWDGDLNEDSTQPTYDTRNEIDVLLTHGIVPVFISCKNGYVTADELYKLNTVATRFGGKYAKKVLVATALDELGDAGEYFRKRAEDMNIKILDNVQKLTDKEFSEKLRTLWCG